MTTRVHNIYYELLMTSYGQQAAKCPPDPSYGNNPAEPDIPWLWRTEVPMPGLIDMPAGNKMVLSNFIIVLYCL